MASFWVITQEGTEHSTEVIGVLSARKSAAAVKDYLEWLHALLNYYPKEHLAFSQYNKPIIRNEAQFLTTNTGVPVRSMLMCGHNPYLVARLAKNVVLSEAEGEKPILKWTDPDRLVCDSSTRRVVEKIPGKEFQAPVHLPLRIVPNKEEVS